MGSDSALRPLVVLCASVFVGFIIGHVIVEAGKVLKSRRKDEEIEEKKETIQEKETEENEGCCGGGSCGPKNVEEKSKPKVGCCGGGGVDSGSCGVKIDDSEPVMAKVAKICFLVGSRSGAATAFGEKVKDYIVAFNETIPTELVEIDSLTIQQVEELFKEPQKTLYVLIMASYPADDYCDNFRAYLQESSTDWRVGANLTQAAGLIPILLGDSTFGADLFCEPGRQCSKLLGKLGCVRSNWFQIDNLHEKPEARFKEVCQLIDETITCGQVEEPVEDSDEEEEEEDDIDELIDDGTSCRSMKPVDLEDLGEALGKSDLVKRGKVKPARTRVPKEMINDKLRTALTKQGYTLVGSHSGVKICRWTKSQLRGRGGCYKHSFYGIESHRCMEATPSLACANKCVFCWRHHTNPVGTEWRWVTDPPELIVDALLEGHRKMIKQLRGVPGVTDEKMVEANNPVHCALSLVGEPIMYPHIGPFVDLLHGKGISSYLVTNATFPDAIKTLPPVTQLYTSIDGSSKEELKAIDRPLHKDFWERFIASLENLNGVKGRTVYRLTLVDGFNLSDAQGYARLVAMGNPDFIEIKGVTYCGTSNNAELSMKNVPWHEQVIEFCSQLTDQLEHYSIACEHEHSNCVLIAHHKFKSDENGVAGWKTWIDYPKFQHLYDEWKTNGTEFEALDYSVETPTWAVFGSDERGFDPGMKRHHRNRKIRQFEAGANGPVLVS